MSLEQMLRVKNNRIITFDHMEMMGIVNVTPDSFYSGSRMETEEMAYAKAMEHLEEGALFLDVGGESTRPGSAPVTEEEEIRRICPVIQRIRKAAPEAVISADTYRAGTAQAALEAGADMINDISGLTFEPELARVIAHAGAGVVIMHTGGRPRTMQQNPRYVDVVEEVRAFLVNQISFAVDSGIGIDQIMIDVGIGFGKTAEHNLELLHRVDRFDDLGCPHLLAASRKSFLGKLLGRENAEDRLPGTLAVTSWGALHGMAAARVHDVKENLDAARTAEALMEGSRQ